MKRLPFANSESGTSLVELLIGLAILAIIGTFSANFFSRLSSADVEASARANAVSQINGFADTIDRDLKFRRIPDSGTLTKLCGANSCTKAGFTFSRMAPKAGGGEIDYDVTIVNSCKPIPGTIAKHFKSKPEALDFSKTAIDKISKQIKADGGATSVSVTGACLAAIQCAKGEFPHTKFEPKNTAGASKLPIYPPGLPVVDASNNFKRGFSSGIVAAATCANSTDNADRVTVEAIIVTAEGMPRIEKKEVVLPRGNVAKIQILPTPP